MGFLTKWFGKKNKDANTQEVTSRENYEALDEGGLTPEEEAAAEAAETAFFEARPDIAAEDPVAEQVRLEQEEEARAAAEQEARAISLEATDVHESEQAENMPATETDEGGLTPEEEAAAEAAETSFFTTHPDIASEDMVAEEIRLKLEKETQETVQDIHADGKMDQEEEDEMVQEAPVESKGSFWSRLKSGLSKTRSAIFAPVDNLLKSFTKVDEDFLEELEEILISADVGMSATEEILDQLRARIKDGRLKEKEQVMDALKEIMSDMIGESQPLVLNTTPSVLLVIGVNGAGKTTSIGKISKRLKLAHKKVVVAAADTFRAAAIDQLAVWCERAGVEMVRQNEGSDPAAVVFDAIAVAKKKQADVLIIDTAGRLQNKKNLMNELAKIDRVIDRELPEAARETLLVLDATTGQNAVSQAKEFSQAAKITGITLNKLDGTAKGGIIISIKEELNIPVKFVGVGEKIDDMQEFDPQDFVRALFES